MISKRSFLNIMQFDFRRRSWLSILHAAVQIFLLPVLYLIRLQNASFNARAVIENGIRLSREQDLIRQQTVVTRELFSAMNFSVTALLITAAFVSAVTGFSWLCSRHKVDFFHGLAIPRGRIYRALYADGALMIVIPYAVVCLVAFFGIGTPNHMVSRESIAYMGLSLGANVLVFLAVYSICILAMLVSGRILIGVLLSVMLLVYAPLASFLYHAMMEMSFSTYIDTGKIGAGIYLSPLTLAVLNTRIGTGASDISPAVSCGWLLAFAVAGTAAGYLIYRKRPSEAAGNAYIHPVIQAVCKVAVAIPSALVGGIIFREITYSSQSFWFAAGSVTGVLAACIVMELVQSVDYRNIVRHWKSTLIAAAGTVVIVLVLLTDPAGYDTYLPKKEDLSAIGFVNAEWALADQTGYAPYYAPVSGRDLSDLLTENIDAVYPLAAEGVAHVGTEITESNETTYVQVVYQLKNGSRRCRAYQVSPKTVQAAMDALTEDRSAREKLYPINDMSGQMFNRISVTDWISVPGDNGLPDEEEYALSENERKALLEAMQIDLNGFSTGELHGKTPVGTLTMLNGNSDEGYRSLGGEMPETYYIYPMYEQTIAFLEGKGYTFSREQKIGQLADGAQKALVYYQGKDWNLTGEQMIRELFEYVEKSKYVTGTEFTSISLEYRDGTDYNVDCIVNDKAAFQRLLEGKEVIVQ